MAQVVEKTKWVFDPNKAVRLLLGSEEETFAFEYEISLYLLFAWALWPPPWKTGTKSKTTEKQKKLCILNVKNTARCLGSAVTFTKIKENKVSRHLEPRAARIKLLSGLLTRSRRSWYKVFDQNFIELLGGLSEQFIGAKNAKSRQKAIKEAWDDTLLVRDIVSYLCKMQHRNSGHVLGKSLVAPMQKNIFNRKDYRQRRRKEELSKSKIFNALETGNEAAVLLYAFDRRLSGLPALKIGSRSFLKDLCQVTRERKNIVEALLYYRALVELLRPAMDLIPSLKRWNVLNIEGEVPQEIIDEVQRYEVFDDGQQSMLDKLKVARAGKSQ